MKKILAIALVIAMVLAVMPATFAAETATKSNFKSENTMERAYEQKALNANGEFVTSKGTTAKASDLSNVNEKYQSMTVTKTGEVVNTKAVYEDVETMGVAEIDLELAATRGYWLSSEEEGTFTEITDWYTDGAPVYCQRFAPIEGDLVKAYAKGETVFVNYDLFMGFDKTSGEFTLLDELEDDAYNMNIMVLGGELQADGNTISLNTIGSWSNGSSDACGLGVEYTAPQDDYYFFFVVVVDKIAALDGFGAWLQISSIEKEADLKTVSKGADMTVGKAVSTNLGSNDTTLVVAPCGESYIATYAQAHKIELEGGKLYVAEMNSADSIGGTVWFCDANMNAIACTYLPAEALTMGYDYTAVSMCVWPTETGTYYIVTGGYWMTDEGNMDVTVMNWEDCSYAPELTPANEAINLDELGNEDVIADNNSWAYHWFSEDKAGMLILAMPGTYTLKGDASDTFVVAYDAVKIVYDNAKTAAVNLVNEMAPVSISVKGKATIADNNIWGYSIFNDPGANGGLYITGDELTVNGIFGIVMDNAPITLASKKLVVDTTSAEGYYPIAIWVVGKDAPTLSTGNSAKFDNQNKVAQMFYDEGLVGHYGYTVSTESVLWRVGENGCLDKAVLYFELTTDGTISAGGASLPGDANLDGTVNTGDAVTILKHASEILTLEGAAFANADMNADGKVNTGDAVAVLKVVAGL